MIDAEVDILKAFLAALTQQSDRLPDDVQAELNTIAQTLNVAAIDQLTQRHQPLKDAYENAHVWLVKHSNQRNKGRDVKPNATSEKQATTNTEIDNASSDIQELNSLSDIMLKIEQRLDNPTLIELAFKILKTPESVESAKSTIFPLIVAYE